MMSQSTAVATTVAVTADGELVSPEGTQGGKKTCHPATIKLKLLPLLSSEETQDVETQHPGPR